VNVKMHTGGALLTSNEIHNCSFSIPAWYTKNAPTIVSGIIGQVYIPVTYPSFL
jgi:hypothetical protein